MSAARDLAREIVEAARRFNLKIAIAESCTGGLVSAAITDIAGSSAVLDRGFVTYSNEAKTEMLGVDGTLIARDGAVSESVARAMAEGALRNSTADIAIAITGIAGPGGGSEAKPIGLVHFASARRREPTQHFEARFGDLGRSQIRKKAAQRALEMVFERIQ